MRTLITGASGMTGAELARQARARGWDVTALTHDDLDVAVLPSVEDAIGRAHPDVVFNAAAYTAVDAAEDAAENAMAVNGTGAGNVALTARYNDALIVHISTDYVFSGASSVAYKPDDVVGPLNVYGESKLAGEIAVRDECPNHVIVRTSWVYSHEVRRASAARRQRSAWLPYFVSRSGGCTHCRCGEISCGRNHRHFPFLQRRCDHVV
jgi:dTDP-4-dehydrorhamnose reductase